MLSFISHILYSSHIKINALFLRNAFPDFAWHICGVHFGQFNGHLHWLHRIFNYHSIASTKTQHDIMKNSGIIKMIMSVINHKQFKLTICFSPYHSWNVSFFFSMWRQLIKCDIICHRVLDTSINWSQWMGLLLNFFIFV